MWGGPRHFYDYTGCPSRAAQGSGLEPGPGTGTGPGSPGGGGGELAQFQLPKQAEFAI